ncbi:MAG: hypothetical protein ACJA0F_001970 [Dinoroseobacter sp.]
MFEAFGDACRDWVGAKSKPVLQTA